MFGLGDSRHQISIFPTDVITRVVQPSDIYNIMQLLDQIIKNLFLYITQSYLQSSSISLSAVIMLHISLS